MDLSDARQRLERTIRHELRDHAFGDREVTWVRGDMTVATGYFGDGNDSVSFDGVIGGIFHGEDARALLECGELYAHRNDTTGPEEYEDGKIMPGLTKHNVFEELTSPPEDVR